MNIKVMVIDDEAPARDELVFLLQRFEEIEVVGQAEDGLEALEKINLLEPEVIFLDIQMPDMDGITVAKKLYEKEFTGIIVFATAYDQHAIDAFEVNAIDYLLKPFDEDRLEKTIERVRSRLDHPEHDRISQIIRQMLGAKDGLNGQGIQEKQKRISKLSVQGLDGIVLIDPTKIVYAYRESRDVLIKTHDESYPTKYTLQTLEEKLADFHFFRTHRSYLVNLDYIVEMIPWFNGAYNLILNDSQRSKVPVSRQYVKELREALEL